MYRGALHGARVSAKRIYFRRGRRPRILWRMSKRILVLLLLVLLLLWAAPLAAAQSPDTATWAATAANQYRVVPNLTYLTANNWEAKLDVYARRDVTAPQPTLIYIHGGGWVGGTREAQLFNFLPYLEMGWTVVNVSYRLARISEAPAAVEDCRCALRWVIRNAKDYNIDTKRLVVTGHSAGGHLSLTTGILPVSAGLDRQCPGSPGSEDPKVAAIVNWYGITEVEDILDGANIQNYAVQWLGSMPNRNEVARRVSPLTYIRAGLPPIVTIHGDADRTVPYSHATRLHEALSKAGVPNQLLTIPGGKHGGFTREEMLKAYGVIREFLRKNGL